MNVISTIQGLGFRRKAAPPPPNPLTIANSKFDGYTVSNNSQYSIPNGDTSKLVSWTQSTAPSNGTNQSGRLMNNFSQNNTTVGGISSPGMPAISNYCLWLQQQASLTFSISQSVNFTLAQTYTVSLWAGSRQTYYNSSQKVRMYIDDVQVGSDITFTTGATGNNWAKFSGTYVCTSTGNHTLKISWVQTASNDSTVCVTGIEIQ